MDLQAIIPFSLETYSLADKKVGLVVIDVIKGFCEVGAGSLAPVEQNVHMDQMLENVNALAQRFSKEGRPIFAFIDAHEHDKLEPPYPSHCLKNSNESELMDVLNWLYEDQRVTCFYKDCINGYIGAIDLKTRKNIFEEWVKKHGLDVLIFAGVCTDICVSDCVLTVLSARNHGLLGKLEDVVVYLPACSTYEMQDEYLEKLGLPDSMRHPQALMHHIGAKMMQSRGAILANHLI